MESVNLTNLRQNLKFYLDKVFTMGKPLFISRPKGEDLVLLSKSEYNSLQETFHLMKSPANLKRLGDAIEKDQSNEGLVPFEIEK